MARSFLAALALHGLCSRRPAVAPSQDSPAAVEFVPVQIIPPRLGVRPPRSTTAQDAAGAAAETRRPPPRHAERRSRSPSRSPRRRPRLPTRRRQKEAGGPHANPAPPAAPLRTRGDSRAGSGKAKREVRTAPGETGASSAGAAAPGNPPAPPPSLRGWRLDNPDFTYAYYLDRMLSLIDANGLDRHGSGVKATIFFRIGRDGKMTDLQVEQSSGYNSFDLAALRAVQNAAPFPPLPRAYKHEDLGVHLIVR